MAEGGLPAIIQSLQKNSYARAGSTIELPPDVQRIIFETAANLDGRSAYRLILLARYVQDWIHPILYERIVIRDRKSAASILKCAQAHGPKHFLSHTKSLTVDKQIPKNLIRPLFAKLSKSVTSLTIFRDTSISDHLLRYLRSPSIRRLTLVYHDVLAGNRLEIPHNIASSISHLTLISNTSHGGFSMRHSIQIASFMQNNNSAIPLPTTSLSPFHHLTFIAISYERWPEMFRVLTLARGLKCFAVLLPTSSSMRVISRCVSEIRGTRDPRVIVAAHHGHPLDWSSDQGFVPSDFWTTVEDLSRNRYICDDGERWEEVVIDDFRAQNPEISLLGD